jgi:hypothetical protein
MQKWTDEYVDHKITNKPGVQDQRQDVLLFDWKNPDNLADGGKPGLGDGTWQTTGHWWTSSKADSIAGENMVRFLHSLRIM